MRPLCLSLFLAASLGATAACDGSNDTLDSTPSSRAASTSTPAAATSALPEPDTSSTIAPDRTVVSTAASTATTPGATEVSEVTVAVDPLPRVEFESPSDITAVGLFGDSLVADLTAIGGRNNQVVPQITMLLVDDAALAVERVENLALPGQSVVADLGVLSTEEATLRPYVEQTLRQRPELVDLAVIAISSSDINLNASLAEPLPTSVLAQDMLAELIAVEALFEAAGIDVAFLPIFGISDTVFSELRCALAPSCPAGPDAAIVTINEFFWESGLPMLFAQFDRLDGDGDGRTDPTWFEGVDARYPDDGIHPNATGQALYSTTVYEALRPLLS